jgi:hypothetical protein
VTNLPKIKLPKPVFTVGVDVLTCIPLIYTVNILPPKVTAPLYHTFATTAPPRATAPVLNLNWLDSKKKTFFSYSNSQIFKLIKLKEKLLVTHSMPF